MGANNPTTINGKAWYPGWIEGEIYGLDTEEHDGNFLVLRGSGSAWDYLGFSAVSLALHPDGSLWATNHRGDIRVYRDGIVKHWPGRARQVAIGRGGEIWGLGMEETEDGYPVLEWTGSEWNELRSDGGVDIAVDPEGRPWIVDREGSIFRHDGEKWVKIPGWVRQIAISRDGTPWARSWIGQHRGDLIVSWNGEEWVTMEMGAEAIAIDSAAIPWVVTNLGQVFVLAEKGEWGPWWRPVASGVKGLAVGKASFRMESTVFKGVSPALPEGASEVSIQVEEGRGKVSVIQQPAERNDSTAIVEFDDDEPEGAAFYEVTIGWKQVKQGEPAGE
jgi:hypothetical protein